MACTILFLVLFFTQFSIAADPILAMKEVQTYPRAQYFLPTELPRQFNDRYLYRFPLSGKGKPVTDAAIELFDLQEGTSQTLLQWIGSGPVEYRWLAQDPSKGEIYFLENGKLKTIKIPSGELHDCTMQDQTWLANSQLIRAPNGVLWIFSSLGTSNLRIGSIASDCSVSLLTTINNVDPTRARIATLDDTVYVYTDQSKWGSYSGTQQIQEFKISVSGQVTKGLTIPGRTFNEVGPYCLASVGKTGVLLTLAPSKLSSLQNPSVFLISNEGTAKELISDAECGSWTKSGDVLISRGKHSGSHELVLYRAPEFVTTTLVPTPVGYKAIASVVEDTLYFVNEELTGTSHAYKASLQTLKEFEELKWIEPPKLENAILPVVKEVEFKSREGRRVPGYLLTPDECSKLDPRPAVIFLHGGSFASFGNTQKVFTTQNNETRLFVQFGNVVFLPGYYGDCYFGTEFREKTPRFVDKERFRPQLEDVAEALRFIRGLPCVDTKKIAIIGHSYGAMIGAVFATSSQNFGQDQIKFIVLRGGIYDEKGIKEFTDFQIEKVAFPEGDAARKYLSVASLKERGVPLFYPSSGIESVDDALKIHAELETEKFYGVYYRLSQSFYEEVTPVNRAPHIRPDLPVYIYHGLKDHVQTAYSFEVAIKKYSHKVHSWYPDDGHTFSGDIQIEMVKRIQAVLTN